jgi:hypothetical protein
MASLKLALTSRTVWTVVLMFVIGGTNAIAGVIPAGWETPIMGILAIAAAYFKVSPSQTYPAA